jgi:hypothetical protein
MASIALLYRWVKLRSMAVLFCWKLGLSNAAGKVAIKLSIKVEMSWQNICA